MSQLTTVVDEKVKVYQGYQNDIKKLFAQKQELLSQFNENTLVKGELDMLTPENGLYKLVGPILMNVDQSESQAIVGKRLDFIETEIKKLDTLIAAKQGDQTTLGMEIQKEQAKMQQEAAAAAQAIANASQA